MSEIIVDGIKGLVSDVHIYDFDESIRASKYPMSTDIESLNSDVTKTTQVLGKAKIGSGHDNFLNGIRVSFDLTLSVEAWAQAERYHFLDFVSSQSKMHRALQFNLNSQCNEYVDCRVIDIVNQYIAEYNRMCKLPATDDIETTLKREAIMDELFFNIIYNIPLGFQLTARMTTDYRQLKTIYYQRRTHRLPEWQILCQWMETTLPQFKALCLS